MKEGKFMEKTENKILKVIHYTDGEKEYKSVKIIREDGSKTVLKREESDFAEKYEKIYQELLDTYTVEELKNPEKGIVSVEEVKAIRNLKVNWKVVTSLIIAGAIVWVGKSHYGRFVKNNAIQNNTQSNEPIITSAPKVTPTPAPTKTPVPTQVPTKTPEPVVETQTYQGDNLPNTIDFELLGIPTRTDVVRIEVDYENGKYGRIYTKTDNKTEDIDEMIALANNTTNCIIFNTKSSNAGSLVYYENLFVEQPEIASFVAHFSKFYNGLVEESYSNQTTLRTEDENEYVKLANSEIIRLICNDNPLEVTLENGKKVEVCYNDLPEDAKYVVLSIASQFLALHIEYFPDKFVIDGQNENYALYVVEQKLIERANSLELNKSSLTK